MGWIMCVFVKEVRFKAIAFSLILCPRAKGLLVALTLGSPFVELRCIRLSFLTIRLIAA